MGNHPSGPGVATGLEPPTRGSAGRVIAPVWRCTGWGLPSRRVTAPLVRSYRTFSPLPATADGRLGGVLSVALSVGFPRLGVTQHPALRCPDFPRDLAAARLPGLQAQHIAVPRSHDACVSRPHPTLRGGFGMRFATLTAGLLLYGYGELLTVRAGIGLGPWDVFHSGHRRHHGHPVRHRHGGDVARGARARRGARRAPGPRHDHERADRGQRLRPLQPPQPGAPPRRRARGTGARRRGRRS